MSQDSNHKQSGYYDILFDNEFITDEDLLNNVLKKEDIQLSEHYDDLNKDLLRQGDGERSNSYCSVASSSRKYRESSQDDTDSNLSGSIQNEENDVSRKQHNSNNISSSESFDDDSFIPMSWTNNIVDKSTGSTATAASSLEKDTTTVDANFVNGRPICKYFQRGHCMRGSSCHFAHVLPSQVNLEDTGYTSSEFMEFKCPLCNNNVISQGKRFGLMESCSHVFCLNCIKNWRQAHKGDPNLRCCPICHNDSYFVIPSNTPIMNETIKQQIIKDYKKNMSSIPCKFFNHGKGQCPFGSSCFYSHKDSEGNDYVPRLVVTSDGDLVPMDNRYSFKDLIDAETKKSKSRK
ncbi:hypothetical protein WA158_005470 [Blastocystis sp. Blastoise]